MQIQLKKQHSRYSKYKQTGIPWLGEVPEGWAVLPFKRIVAFQSGDGFSDEFQGNESGQIPFYKVSDINSSGKYVEKSNNYVSLKDIAKNRWHLIPVNSILTAKIGAALLKNHRKICRVPCFIDNNMLAIIPRKLDFGYLFWLMYNLNFAEFQNISSVPSVNMQMLREHMVIAPSVNEQEVITNYIDEKSVLIESIIEAKQKQIKLLKERRSALINCAVTQGIHKDAEMKDSGIEWIGKVPKNWRIEKLKRLGRAIIGLTYSPEDVCDESGTLVLRSSNVQNGKISLGDNVFVSKKIPTKLQTKVGDILICSRNGSRALIGKNACIDAESSGLTFGAFMTIFRSRNWRFLSYVFKSSLFNGQSESFLTSTINQLTIDNLNNMVVVLPDTLAEQAEIIDYLEFETKKITSAFEKIEQSIALLQEYKTSLVSSVVTGKVKII